MPRIGLHSLRRTTAVGLVLGAVALFLAGCTGDGEAAAFRRAFVDDAAVASMELTSGDNQPFTGGVSGEVLAHDALPDDNVRALATRLSDYTAAHSAQMRGRVSLVSDGFACEISGEQSSDDGCLSLLLALRGDDRAAGGVLSPGWPEVRARSVDDGVELARDLPRILDGVGDDPERTVSISTDDRRLNLTGADGHRRAEVVRLWEIVSAGVPLTGISSREDGRITVALERETDLSQAEGLVAQGFSQGVPEVAFSSDVIRLGDADGRLARQLRADLDPQLATRIEYLWESSSRLQIVSRTASDLPALVRPVLGALPAEVTGVELMASGSRLVLEPGTTPSDSWLASLSVLLDDDAVSSLALSAEAVDLTVEEVPDDDLGRFAPALKALSPEGSRVCVVREDDSVCLVAADRVDEELLNAHSRERARSLIASWNAS